MPLKPLRIVLLMMAIASSLLFSCNESRTEEPVIEDFGYDYFPLEVGRTWEYEVDSVIYDPAIGGTAVDSFRTFIRESIVDTLLDNTGQVLFRLERYYRRSDTMAWQVEKVLTLSRDEQRASRTEDNLRFTKLVFPVREGKFWDGNAFFDDSRLVFVAGESIQMFKNWQYRILASGVPAAIGGMEFDDVVTVQNADNRYLNNFLELRLATEQYARGVGLISRELFIWDTSCLVCCGGNTEDGICQSLPWEERVEKGFTLRQRLIRYQ
ncbi:MAG: hypothetical protein KDD19_12665 [Phaeodactylibacter sp.]|nr:hypothetical protein [Phaeodactylibacter sp.]MCB9049873.1 hypothetical protein [Lewinellaceae bacterium]